MNEIASALRYSFKGVGHAIRISFDQISEIFGHSDVTSVDTSSIITNPSDREKVKEVIKKMLEEQKDNINKPNPNSNIKKEVELVNGETIVLKL